MPLKHLRVCEPCDQIRFAACSAGCRVPDAADPTSWRENLQEGAGTILPPPALRHPDQHAATR